MIEEIDEEKKVDSFAESEDIVKALISRRTSAKERQYVMLDGEEIDLELRDRIADQGVRLPPLSSLLENALIVRRSDRLAGRGDIDEDRSVDLFLIFVSFLVAAFSYLFAAFLMSLIALSSSRKENRKEQRARKISSPLTKNTSLRIGNSPRLSLLVSRNVESIESQVDSNHQANARRAR